MTRSKEADRRRKDNKRDKEKRPPAKRISRSPERRAPRPRARSASPPRRARPSPGRRASSPSEELRPSSRSRSGTRSERRRSRPRRATSTSSSRTSGSGEKAKGHHPPQEKLDAKERSRLAKEAQVERDRLLSEAEELIKAADTENQKVTGGLEPVALPHGRSEKGSYLCLGEALRQLKGTSSAPKPSDFADRRAASSTRHAGLMRPDDQRLRSPLAKQLARASSVRPRAGKALPRASPPRASPRASRGSGAARGRDDPSREKSRSARRRSRSRPRQRSPTCRKRSASPPRKRRARSPSKSLSPARHSKRSPRPSRAWPWYRSPTPSTSRPRRDPESKSRETEEAKEFYALKLGMVRRQQDAENYHIQQKKEADKKNEALVAKANADQRLAAQEKEILEKKSREDRRYYQERTKTLQDDSRTALAEKEIEMKEIASKAAAEAAEMYRRQEEEFQRRLAEQHAQQVRFTTMEQRSRTVGDPRHPERDRAGSRSGLLREKRPGDSSSPPPRRELEKVVLKGRSEARRPESSAKDYAARKRRSPSRRRESSKRRHSRERREPSRKKRKTRSPRRITDYREENRCPGGSSKGYEELRPAEGRQRAEQWLSNVRQPWQVKGPKDPPGLTPVPTREPGRAKRSEKDGRNWLPPPELADLARHGGRPRGPPMTVAEALAAHPETRQEYDAIMLRPGAAIAFKEAGISVEKAWKKLPWEEYLRPREPQPSLARSRMTGNPRSDPAAVARRRSDTSAAREALFPAGPEARRKAVAKAAAAAAAEAPIEVDSPTRRSPSADFEPDKEHIDGEPLEEAEEEEKSDLAVEVQNWPPILGHYTVTNDDRDSMKRESTLRAQKRAEIAANWKKPRAAASSKKTPEEELALERSFAAADEERLAHERKLGQLSKRRQNPFNCDFNDPLYFKDCNACNQNFTVQGFSNTQCRKKDRERRCQGCAFLQLPVVDNPFAALEHGKKENELWRTDYDWVCETIKRALVDPGAILVEILLRGRSLTEESVFGDDPERLAAARQQRLIEQAEERDRRQGRLGEPDPNIDLALKGRGPKQPRQEGCGSRGMADGSPSGDETFRFGVTRLHEIATGRPQGPLTSGPSVAAIEGQPETQPGWSAPGAARPAGPPAGAPARSSPLGIDLAGSPDLPGGWRRDVSPGTAWHRG